MEPGLGDSAWDVLKVCLVWALVWPGLAWFGLVGRRAPPETSSEFAWFGPWFGLVWARFRLRRPHNLPGLALVWVGLGTVALETSSQFARFGPGLGWFGPGFA